MCLLKYINLKSQVFQVNIWLLWGLADKNVLWTPDDIKPGATFFDLNVQEHKGDLPQITTY